MNIVLPWPSADLSPNARVHHMAKHRATKSYRKTCWVLALEQKVKLDLESAEKIKLAFIFRPPDFRHYDADNLLARMKSGLDGLADALGINDHRFQIQAVVIGTPKKPGSVEVGTFPSDAELV